MPRDRHAGRRRRRVRQPAQPLGIGGWSTGQCTIGSVKSNIGHALTAAGSAGLLKVLFAFKHQTLPPTANFKTPSPNLDEPGNSPFRILSESQPWPARSEGKPRRAAISGFGFGGINAHALIEEWIPEQAETVGKPRKRPVVPVAIVGMAAHFGPFQGLRAFQERVLGGDIAGEPAEIGQLVGVQNAAWFHNPGKRRLLGERGASAPCPPADPNAKTQRQGRRSPLAVARRAKSMRGCGIEELALGPSDSGSRRAARGDAPPAVAGSPGRRGCDCRRWLGRPPSPQGGVFVGIGLDLNTTNFHVRWSMLPSAERWNEELGLNLTDEALERWITSLRDTAGPPLSANRTMWGGRRSRRQPDRPRVPDRRAELHGLQRRDFEHPGPRRRRPPARARGDWRGHRRGGRPGLRPACLSLCRPGPPVLPSGTARPSTRMPTAPFPAMARRLDREAARRRHSRWRPDLRRHSRRRHLKRRRRHRLRDHRHARAYAASGSTPQASATWKPTAAADPSRMKLKPRRAAKLGSTWPAEPS